MIWVVATVLALTLPRFETGTDPTKIPFGAIFAPIGAAGLAGIVAAVFRQPPHAPQRPSRDRGEPVPLQPVGRTRWWSDVAAGEVEELRLSVGAGRGVDGVAVPLRNPDHILDRSHCVEHPRADVGRQGLIGPYGPGQIPGVDQQVGGRHDHLLGDRPRNNPQELERAIERAGRVVGRDQRCGDRDPRRGRIVAEFGADPVAGAQGDAVAALVVDRMLDEGPHIPVGARCRTPPLPGPDRVELLGEEAHDGLPVVDPDHRGSLAQRATCCRRVRVVPGDAIQYVKAHDGLHIAYQVRGDGPIDVLEIGGFGALFPLDAADDQPRWHRFEDRLRQFARVIKFDLRGIGYSDQLQHTPTVEEWAADALRVLDAVGADEVHLLASSFGGFAAIELAATQAHRVASLTLANSGARFAADRDYEIGISVAEADEWARGVDPNVETGEDTDDIDFMAPSIAGDADVRRWWARTAARGAGPATAQAMWDIAGVADVRERLPSLDVPCLVLATAGNQFIDPSLSGWLAEHIEGAELREIPAPDHVIWAVPDDLVVAEIEQFLTGSLASSGGRRSIAAILFTDIVESTAHNSARGDQAWLELLARHDELAGREIRNRGGRLVKRLGDGLLAVFPLGSEAVHAALAITAGADDLGIGVRAGLHVAEVDEIDDDVLGLGVTVAARVLDEADAGEVVTTRAVADLLTGSSFGFTSRGHCPLKGVDGKWELSSVTRS